jgi:8-oxo-dGTP pyrophosphatase MutT (NUDIX family)
MSKRHKSEYETLMDDLDSRYQWDGDTYGSLEGYESTYISRTTGEVHKTNTDKGDGYWCGTHEFSCSWKCQDRRWGKFGAAGVLFFHRESQTFLLNQRSKAIHHGGTFSTLGGAIDRNEEPFEGAMREAEEEIGHIPTSYWQMAAHEDTTSGMHSDWTYTTFVVEVEEQWTPESGDWESMGNEWVTVQDMATMPLHPSFKKMVPTLVAEMYHAGMFR